MVTVCLFCSEEAASDGFTVLVDNHTGYYRQLKPVIASVTAALGKYPLYVILVLKGDKFSLQEKLKRSKFRSSCRSVKSSEIGYKVLYRNDH